MKVVCLVPSWTETLIEAGIDVVGRTRFCIHPADKVKNIAVVGGTKNFNLQKILQLKPDIVILDKEENTIEMANVLTEHSIRWFSTHVTNLRSCAEELLKLSEIFNHNTYLIKWSEQYLSLIQSKDYNLHFQNLKDLKINYVIWKNPWMCVSKNTFIGSVIDKLGIQLHESSQNLNKKYFEISELDLKNAYCLFSTEPFPFEKEMKKLLNEGFKGELINGESISWFGLRNLKFMLSLKAVPK